MRDSETAGYATLPRMVPLHRMQELVQTSKEPCAHCGEVAALNPHRMCRQKVSALELLAKARAVGEGWCRCEHGRGLRVEETGEWLHAPYRVSEHAARLDWYGLAERRGRREGLFRVTGLGVKFLRDEIRVPERILCRAGKVRHVSIETVSVTEVRGVELDRAYWDRYPTSEWMVDA